MTKISRRAVLVALLAMTGVAGLLHAEAPAARLSTAALFRGVSLDDLAAAHEEEVSPSLDRVASVVKTYLAGQRDLSFRKTVSMSLHEFKRESGTITVDILGRDKVFAVVDRDGLGGMGFIRAEVQFMTGSTDPNEVHVVGHKIVLQRDWVDLEPRVTVSLADRIAVVEDDATGFRRSFPLGVGGVDAVHFKGVTTVMTPTTELAVLDKNQSWRHRKKPRYFKNKAFIPLNVPLGPPSGDGKPVRYRQSAIAFHIWQAPNFRRGFLSHGCMRMRDGDLEEMLAFVVGVKGTIPVKIRIEKVAGAEHPFPYLDNQYNEVQNFGTAQKPVAKKVPDEEGISLTKMRTTHGEPPVAQQFTGMTIDPAPTGPVPGGLMEYENQPRDSTD